MSLVVDIEKKLGSFTLRSQFETDSGTMALLGASGCGKSVTLKCIAGIMTPDRGRIVLDGETLFDSEQRIDLTPQQRRVGYLFQQYALFPNMTVSQNIQCGIRTGSRAEKQRQASEQLRRFRLEGLKKKYPAQLSGAPAGAVGDIEHVGLLQLQNAGHGIVVVHVGVQHKGIVLQILDAHGLLGGQRVPL